jgi:hypothetical protein
VATKNAYLHFGIETPKRTSAQKDMWENFDDK